MKFAGGLVGITLNTKVRTTLISSELGLLADGAIEIGGVFNFPLLNGGGGGKARFNVATPTNATVTCTAYVLPYNFQTKSI